jgi:hypothetical protein
VLAPNIWTNFLEDFTEDGTESLSSAEFDYSAELTKLEEVLK